MSATESPGPSRRTVLCGLAAALLVPGSLAAACGSGAPSGTGNTGAGTGGGTAPGGALAKLEDIPVGKGLVVKGAEGPVLLVRASETEVKAYNAACPHAGTPVSPPAGGTITCPNHGSQFDAATGALKKGPATTGLTPVAVTVADGQVRAA